MKQIVKDQSDEHDCRFSADLIDSADYEKGIMAYIDRLYRLLHRLGTL